MYSVIVVDDEKSIRERIVALLTKRTDFHLLGSYENGYDALMYGVPLEPDLIITDVKMPFVSGLELIERAKEELPAVRSMIISGFDSFDYARKAIELGTLGYISKPIDPEEFNACLDKAVAQLDNYFRLANNEVDKEASRKREREADLERLLTFKAATPQFREKLSEEGIDLHGDGVVVVSFSPDKDEVEITAAEGESLETDLPPLIEDELSGLGHFSYFTPPSAIVLILFDEGYEKEDLAKRVDHSLYHRRPGRHCHPRLSGGKLLPALIMSFYWLLILVVLASFSCIAFCARYVVQLKHQFDDDYKPKFVINEAMVLVIGFVGGSIGLVLSYLSFKELRTEDKFHSYRFLWLTLLALAIHITLFTLLGVYGFITFTGF